MCNILVDILMINNSSLSIAAFSVTRAACLSCWLDWRRETSLIRVYRCSAVFSMLSTGSTRRYE